MNIILYFLIIALLVFFDQASKLYIANNINLAERIVIIKNFFNITNVRNTGGGFSILEDQTLFLSIISFVAVIAFIYMIIKDKNKFNRFCYSLLCAGALGNLIDRVRLKYVIDFLDFIIFGYDFPVFNLADTYITVAAGLIIIKSLLESKNARS